MSRYLTATFAAVVLALASPSDAKAQISLSLGNPYGGGLYGNPYGYSSAYSGFGLAAAPLTSVYSSGYYGGSPGYGYAAPMYGYGVRNYGYAAPSYGYGVRNYGYRGGYGGRRWGGRRW